jgi:putative nucleotidyltransferase with HDIG domain
LQIRGHATQQIPALARLILGKSNSLKNKFFLQPLVCRGGKCPDHYEILLVLKPGMRGLPMNRISVYSEKGRESDDITRSLAGHFEVRFLGLERMVDLEPEEFTVVDIALRQTTHLLPIKEWLKRKPSNGKVILAVNKDSHIEVTRAYAMGATDIVDRPVYGPELLEKLKPSDDSISASGAFTRLAGDGSTFPVSDAPGVAAAVATLQSIFSAACLAGTVDVAAVGTAGEAVVGQIGAQGLPMWVETVRKHHSQTYQHCMLVTGVAVAFGQHIGLSQKDRNRLSIAGMLHDVGKARIPLDILEKPGPLDKDELAVMRQHPQLGVDALGPNSGLGPEMIDMVLHHHECLDGTGYPHSLSATEIPDLVRIMTISDVFGALIERRSYKPPLASSTAYQILIDMGPKLDKDLVRAFRFAAQLDQGI